MGKSAKKTPGAPSKATISALQSEEHAKHMAWAMWLSELKGENFSNLALKAGRASNTLTRMRNSQTATLDALTVRMLTDYWKVPGPETYLLPGTAGFAPEGKIFGDEDRDAYEIVASALRTTPALKAYQISTRALEKSGFESGDIVLVWPGQRPRAGDPVVAEQTDASISAHPLLRFRIIEPPFLRGDSKDPALMKSIHIDDHVQVIGPIVLQVRKHYR